MRREEEMFKSYSKFYFWFEILFLLFVVSTFSTKTKGNISFVKAETEEEVMNIYYVDAVNGNDENSGEIRGNDFANEVSNLEFKNISFKHTRWIYPDKYGVAGGQASMVFSGVGQRGNSEEAFLIPGGVKRFIQFLIKEYP